MKRQISVLDQSTIDKIAAGEVVERPSSVVKELVENAIDAGASAITVEIKEGGTTFIRITDNGAGIDKYRNKIFDGEKMTDEEIVEEIICDAMTQTESAEKLMRAVNNVDSNLVTRIAGCLKAMWDKFCEYMNFKQHKMSNEQQLPNELSVAEFQRADTAFNKILMNLKNDNGEPVFHRVGTELLLRDTNAKPVDTYQVNPIGYTYAVAYSRGFNLKKNQHNPQKQHNSSVLLDSEDDTYKTIQINYLFYEPQPNESQEYRVARRKAELVRFDTDTLFYQGDTIE